MFEFFDTTFGSPANAITLGIVAVLAVERLISAGYVNMYIGKTKIKAEDVPKWAEKLQHHFNHETTEQNEKMIHELREIKNDQRELCRKFDTFAAVAKETNCRIIDIQTDGVRLRNGDNKK